MKIVTPEEMGDIEAQSMVQGVSNADLLHNAGIGIADAITAKFGTPSGMNILVLIVFFTKKSNDYFVYPLSFIWLTGS